MFRSVAAMSGISAVMMLIALDQTVVGTALPRIVAELQGFQLYPWVAAAYLLSNAILIPLTGRLGDLHGRKPFLLFAIVLFTLASALCGLAQTMLELVFARGLQGIGGGMLIGSAFASVSDLFPETLDRIRWQVMLSSAFGIASAVGPVIGGWLTEHLGWRSVFYVNLPIGLIALPIVWRYLPRIVHAHDDTQRSLDWAGVLLLSLTIGCLLMASEFGQQIGFTNPYFWALCGVAVLLCVVFVRHQHKTPAPIIPMRLFEDPTIRLLAALAMLTGLIMFVLIFYAPLLLQGGFGQSPKQAGLLVTPIMVSITIGSIVNGRLLPRLRQPQRLFSGGVIFLMIGIAWLCTITEHSGWLVQTLSFALCGFGLGFQLPNLTLQMQAAANKRDQGAASALIQTLRALGSMFGASIAGMLVNLSFGRRIPEILTQADIHDASVRQLFATPEILIRASDQAQLLKASQQLHFDAFAMLEQSRLGLVAGIHEAFIGCIVICALSFVLSRYLPAFIRHKNSGASQ